MNLCLSGLACNQYWGVQLLSSCNVARGSEYRKGQLEAGLTGMISQWQKTGLAFNAITAPCAPCFSYASISVLLAFTHVGKCMALNMRLLLQE